MDTVAKHLMSVCDFGTKRRLYSGAALSLFDIISDIYIIVRFLGSEETKGVAHITIACVVLSLLMQVLIVLVVNRKRPWRRIAREVLYVRRAASRARSRVKLTTLLMRSLRPQLRAHFCEAWRRRRSGSSGERERRRFGWGHPHGRALPEQDG
jgi:hypothetical protein